MQSHFQTPYSWDLRIETCNPASINMPEITSPSIAPADTRRLRRWRWYAGISVLCVLIAIIVALLWFHPFRSSDTLLNVTYDANRELIADLNVAFCAAHPDIQIRASHEGSIKQARSVIEGLNADVVCLASREDLESIRARRHSTPADWESRLPNMSSAYASTIVFLVRKDNPRGIRDWIDLEDPAVRVIIPHPMTSGAGRWAYLAAYGSELLEKNNNSDAASERVTRIFSRAVIPEAGARSVLGSFMARPSEDVLLTWEHEALRIRNAFPALYDVVYPTRSILARPVITWMDSYVESRQSKAAAEAYVRFYFSPEAQTIMQRHGMRIFSQQDAFPAPPTDTPSIELFRTETVLGEWTSIRKAHFEPEGLLPRILTMRSARSGGIE